MDVMCIVQIVHCGEAKTMATHPACQLLRFADMLPARGAFLGFLAVVFKL